MEKAAFNLDSYCFTKASLNFNIPQNAQLSISFNPQGVFYSKDAHYKLIFDVKVECKEVNSLVVMVSCESNFSFGGDISFKDIPDYFYPNSLAIIFPYVRAFVSTMSLQANRNPILLPTINLMGLTEELKNHTVEC